MRDLRSCLSSTVAIAAAVLSADNIPLPVDLSGFDSAVIELSIGVGGIAFTGANKIEFVLTHSDDDATYTPVVSDDMVGVPVGTGGIIKVLTSAHAAGNSYLFGYIGGKRYLKLLADFSGAHGAGTPIAAVVLKGHPSRQPTPAQI